MLKIVPFLWFADNNCAEAVDYYLSVFPDSSIEEVIYYPDEKLDEHFVGMQGKVLTEIFWLKGQKFMAFDGGPGFRISEAISFTIECEDQAEIDYYWQKLSHVPEAEQCGWAKDRFGVSWQIVPHNMGALLSTDAKMQAMLEMKKIDIEAIRLA